VAAEVKAGARHTCASWRLWNILLSSTEGPRKKHGGGDRRTGAEECRSQEGSARVTHAIHDMRAP